MRSLQRLRSLAPERDLPDRVEFVWHGINDEENLRRYARRGKMQNSLP